MFKRVKFSFLFFFLFFNSVFATGLNDTLTDKQLVNSLLTKAQQLITVDLDSSFYLCDLAIKISKENGDKKGIANAKKIKAVAYYYKGLLDSSLILLNESLQIFKQINEEDEIYKIYNNLGVIYKAKGEYNKALSIYEEAIIYARENKKYEALVGLYTNAANVYKFQGNLQKALDYNFKALRILDSLKEDKKTTLLKATIYSNIAVIFNTQKNFSQARKYYLQALKIYNQLNYKEGIADTYLNLGVLFSDLQNFDSAIVYFKKAYLLYSSPGKKALALFNIGDSFNALEIADSSFKYLIEANKLYEQLDDKRGLAQTYSGLGQYYFLKKDYTNALKYFQKAFKLAREIGDLTILKNVADWSFRVYRQIGDYKNALEMHILFKKFNDSLFNAENERKLTQLALQYDFEKKQREQQLIYEAKIQKQKILSLFIASISGLLIIVLILIYRAFRIKKKSNELLKLKNAEILQQKEEIEAQRDEIEQQKKQIEIQAEEIRKQRDIALRQKKDIEDSIHYAVRIQEAVMPNLHFLKNYFKDFFILFKPRDIVSGDFYWAVRKSDKLILTIADCTGHGVPGAFMSLLGISFLNEIISETTELTSNKILERLREKVIIALKQREDSKTKDGMDLALVIYHFKEKILEYSGAYNSLYFVRDKSKPLDYEYVNEVEILEGDSKILYDFKADKVPIGLGFKKYEGFNRAIIKVQDEDRFYLFTDGFPSLFDFEKNKKYTTKNFKQLILRTSEFDIKKQYQEILQEFDNWIEKNKQIDDVLVGGFEI